MSTPKGASGSISIALGNLKELKGQIDSMNASSERALKKTVADFKSRGPAWVSAAVVEHYGIKKSEVKDTMTGAKKIGSVKISGTLVDNIALEYRGRLLTPTHFKMKPAKIPTKRAKDFRRVPGAGVNGASSDVAMVKPPAPYSVTAEIKKGKRVNLGSSVFLGSNKGAGVIPFQRSGDGRTPVESIKTVSVPQMITNEQVAEQIQKNIDEGLSKRLEHHAERELAKR